MPRQIGVILYWIGILMATPFVLLVGVSIARMFSEGLESKYVNSAFLGLFGAIFSYAVGFMLRHMITQNAERR